jgi:hypothetical protein
MNEQCRKLNGCVAKPRRVHPGIQVDIEISSDIATLPILVQRYAFGLDFRRC